jgi:hypothetical protein
MIAISKTCLKSLQNKNIWILKEYTFNFWIIDGHIEFPYCMLFFDKSNKRSIKLETAVTWSKPNLNMMNIYEESTINFWIWRNYPPLFFFFITFCFTYLYSIKFLYFFINSYRFPYFNLFVSIFIQSYVNVNLMCRPYITVCEILTLGKKRYINVLLYGIYLSLGVSGGTTRTQTMIFNLLYWRHENYFLQ